MGKMCSVTTYDGGADACSFVWAGDGFRGGGGEKGWKIWRDDSFGSGGISDWPRMHVNHDFGQ